MTTFKRLRAEFYQAAGLAYYYLLLGPRGQGRPRPPAEWDRQYRSGHWDFLAGRDELARYAVAAAYIQRLRPRAAVLDLGCGYGRLLEDLPPGSISSYTGIDLSTDAISRARTLARADASFEVAAIDEWESDDRFDVIVFNEVLYYLTNPVRTVLRYERMVNEGGIVLAIMFRHRNTMVIWERLQRRFATLDRIEVRNGQRELTDIRVLVKR